ncbi:MAG: SUF system Fe-S cluster assembly protein [Pseudomonadota bacterium]
MPIFDWLKKAEAFNEELLTEPPHIHADVGDIEQRVIQALRTVYDPEIPVNIYDLGLIYGLEVNDQGSVKIRMTLTAPSCPVAQTFPETVEQTVQLVSGVNDVALELVWEPPWSQEMMSEAARLELGLI